MTHTLPTLLTDIDLTARDEHGVLATDKQQALRAALTARHGEDVTTEMYEWRVSGKLTGRLLRACSGRSRSLVRSTSMSKPLPPTTVSTMVR
jgi:hypothetical protein